MNKLERRRVLQALSCSGLVAISQPMKSLARSCDPVVRTDAGPFYPTEEIPFVEDLTRVPGRSGTAEGRTLYLTGRITTSGCAPVPGAVVEIWQTDDRGNYRHPDAETEVALDPCFRYFAKVRTDEDGAYLFKTIRPRAYTFMDIERAPHIHIRVRHDKATTLTSEVYFEGAEDDALRERDRIFQGRGSRKDTLVVPFRDGAALPAAETSAVYCRFDATLDIV